MKGTKLGKHDEVWWWIYPFNHVRNGDIMGISWEYPGFGQQQWDLKIHPVEKKTTVGWKSWIRWALKNGKCWVGPRVVPAVPLFRIWPEELLTWTHAQTVHFSNHTCKILQICIAKNADNIYINIHQYTSIYINIHQYTSIYINIHQYTSIYINIHQHTITILAYYNFLIHDSTLSSPRTLGGAARDFQVTTGTRIVEASTAGVSYFSPRHWSKVGQKIRYFLYISYIDLYRKSM